MSQRILVAEDDPNLRHVIQLQLEDAGYEVTTAEDGVKTLEHVRERAPDLILLDVMMPRMDGYEVCRRLKSNFYTSRIPIIMLTARSSSSDKVQGLEYGANDYLTKPYVLKEMLARVKGLLQWSKTERESNPLTGLPGNTSIEKETSSRINDGKRFALVYCDIDNFKAFNDYYSYKRGDEAIKMLADILVRAVEELGTKDDIVGHIGGDDFVYVTSPDRAELIGQQIAAEFNQRVVFLYNESERRQGYLEVQDRRGQRERFPFMSITVAVFSSDTHKVTHFAQVIDIVTQVKAYGKSIPGSVVVKERRTEQQKISEARTGT